MGVVRSLLRPRGLRLAFISRFSGIRHRTLVRTASGTLLLRVAGVGVSFLLTIALARALGTSGYGAYAYAIAWVGILGVPSTLGLERYLVRRVATYQLREEWGLMRGLLSAAAVATIATSIVIAVVAGVVGGLLLDGALRTAFLLGMPLVPLTSITIVRQGAMQGLRHVVQGQLPDFIIRPALLLLVVVIADLVFGLSLDTGVVLVMAIGAAGLASVVGSTLLVRAVPEPVKRATSSFRIREWAHGTLPMMLFAGIAVTNASIVTVALGTFTSATAAGQFNVMARVAEGIILLGVAINATIAPHIARSFAAGELAEVQRLVTKAARISLLWTIPVAVLLVVFHEQLLGLFGPAFAAPATPFAILVLGQVFNVTMGKSGTLLLMTGHERRAAFCVGMGATTNVVLACILVPLWGLTGGALSATLSLCVAAGLLTWSANSLLAIQTLGLARTRMRFKDQTR